jgi:hypothetical protein
MKHTIIVVSLLAAAPVAAQPASPSCRLNIARAPEDVRAVVEQWVYAEPKCNISIEVRIVPTEGGLYLLARDEFNRVRERIVPDAQSAGVLVASWVAADSAQTPYQVRRPEPVAAVPPPPEAGAPGLAPVIVGKPAPSPRSKWLTLGGMFAMSGTGGGGVRGELDLRAGETLSLGLAASASKSGINVEDTYYQSTPMVETFDAKAIAYAALTSGSGKWHIRTELGAGLVYTAATLYQTSAYGWEPSEAQGVFPTGEASLTVVRDLGARWGIYAGPLVSLYIQRYEYDAMSTYPYPNQVQTLERRDLEAMMFIGVRHRL